MRTRIRKIFTAVAAVGVLGAVGASTMSGTASAHGRWAQATLRSADGTRVGTVEFGGDRHSDSTQVTVRLRRATGLTAFHGLHIHANDTAANGDGCIADPAQASSTWFVSADGHWKHDPAELHGNHSGDLPSPFVNADGTASIEFDIDKLTPEEVVGRAVVLHAGPDNFGNVPVGPNADQYTPGSAALAKTQGTGNAGDRFACGVIKEH
jgi:superoxide dismutase, Cu-Zn family